MSDKRPVIIIYDDGTAEQIEPVNIFFFESVARSFAAKAEELKQRVTINPPETKANTPPEPTANKD